MSNVYNVCYFLKKGNADWVKVYWRNRYGGFITADDKAGAVAIAMATIKSKVKDAGGSIVGRQVTNFQTVDADGTTRTYSNFMAIKMYVDGPVDDDAIDDDDDDVDDSNDDVDTGTEDDDFVDDRPEQVYNATDSGYDITIHVSSSNRPDVNVNNVTRADGSTN